MGIDLVGRQGVTGSVQPDLRRCSVAEEPARWRSHGTGRRRIADASAALVVVVVIVVIVIVIVIIVVIVTGGAAIATVAVVIVAGRTTIATVFIIVVDVGQQNGGLRILDVAE